MIPTACIDEWNTWFTRVYSWVSGGKDSTALSLALFEQQEQINAEIILIHINTGLRMKSAEDTITKLRKKTKFGYIELKADIPRKTDLLKESFAQLDKAREAKEQGNYNRRIFPCCDHLKHRPGKEFIKTIPKRERERYVFLSGITPQESRRRGWFLNGLKVKNTYHIWNTKMHSFYSYPFRDLYSTSVIDWFLSKHGFNETQHSGCVMCPILLLFNLEHESPIRWIRSKRFVLQHSPDLKWCGSVSD
ncbi:hypothetical protein KAR91_25265 [Candidatus Pacearchaeota archaeon]|nr:hypothetical protein [Candidatus Pacearchaeota archaeon]